MRRAGGIDHWLPPGESLNDMVFSLRWAAFLGTAHAVVPTVEIAPGVDMPQVNLGTCCGSEATDAFPVWFSAGGRGVDTALDYGKEVPGGTQAELGAALVKSGVARDEVYPLLETEEELEVEEAAKQARASDGRRQHSSGRP